MLLFSFFCTTKGCRLPINYYFYLYNTLTGGGDLDLTEFPLQIWTGGGSNQGAAFLIVEGGIGGGGEIQDL